MKQVFTYISILLLFASCSKYEYWDISHFSMDKNALEDSEEIKILYTSRGPDSNNDLEYYYHLVVVSQKSGDTVNVLTTANNGITKKDENKVFNYFNQENDLSKIIQLDKETLDKLTHVDELSNFEMKNITKVARDPEFDHIADNNFPTVIGSIGTMLEEGDWPSK